MPVKPTGQRFTEPTFASRRHVSGAGSAGGAVHDPPDWVCEILSSNRKHDTITKFEVLGRARVRHYWLVDVAIRELVVHRWDSTGWVRVGAFVADEPAQRARIEPFEALEIELGVLFGDDPSD